ncbi:sensory box histidine kinase/response regulator [Enhygromyxa salina]|uniref:histidine kinase n=1 Tax=Enhygromyxa salina TaxID=215803 RepID=A0A0C1ZL63_9BACT|nr:ATP-binding protein [Enhygromyxa salina]KIG18264.1 sensory box histidine kinase/response regulator [Enhygromyxa salina]
MNAKQTVDDDPVTTLVVGREQSFEWIIRRMPGVVYRCSADPELTMHALTHGVSDLLGYPAGDFIDNAVRSWASVVHPEDRPLLVELLGNMLDSGSAQPDQIEYRLLTADGRERWVQHKAWVVRDEEGAPVGLEGFIFEVTEHRLLQLAEAERLVAFERHQRALFALATNPAVVEGRIDELVAFTTELVIDAVLVDRVGVWLFDERRTRLELIDLYVRASGVHERGATITAADFPNYFAALNSGRTVVADDAVQDPHTSEFADTYLRPNNIVGLLDAAIRVGGEIVGIICLEQVTEPREWQRHEIEFAGEVADQIALGLYNRARLAAQAREQLLQEQLLHSQKMDALGRLAGGVAHDFNNLLMAISGSAELLEMRLEDATLRSSAQDIIGASQRAGELTEQLRGFSRQQPLALQNVDLCVTVRKLGRMLRRSLGRGVQLVVTVPEDPVIVRATEGLMQQLLTNLVVNARDAVSHDGRIEIEVEVAEFSEVVSDLPESLPAGRYASVVVRDDGVGMSPEIQARVFEPFFTTKPPGEGTGLGLATVYSIARRCEGTVKLTSEVGVGSQFFVLLPLVSS